MGGSAGEPSRAEQRAQLRAAHKALRKAEKAQAKADEKQYDRNHAGLKRQQAFHATLLAAQVKRGKREARRQAGGNQAGKTGR